MDCFDQRTTGTSVQSGIGISRMGYVERRQGLTQAGTQVEHVESADSVTSQVLWNECELGQMSYPAERINGRAHIMKMSRFDGLSQQLAKFERDCDAHCHVARIRHKGISARVVYGAD